MWFEIARTLSEYYTQHKEKEQQVRDRLSIVFSSMSDLLEGTAKDLEGGVYPHGKCATMSVLATELTARLVGKMEVDKLDELHKMLFEAAKLEREFASRENPATIKELYVAAGKLKALSILIKV